MPNIYSNTGDGRIQSHYTGSNPTWALSRDAATGTAVTTNESSDDTFVAVSRFGSRGGGANTYKVQRSFLVFDVSSITSTVVEVSLNIHGSNDNSGSIWGVKGGLPLIGGLAVSQFDDIPGYSAGNQMFGNVTDYTGIILTTSWSTNSYNSLLGTSSLRADIKSQSVITIVLTDYTYDARNDAPTSNGTVRCGGYYTDNTGTSKDPYLEIRLATGYAHPVNTIAGSNILKINAVEIANVSKIITVE